MTDDSYSILMQTIPEEDPGHRSDPEDSVQPPTKQDIRKRVQEMYYTDYTTMCIYCLVCCGFISLVVIMSLAAWKIQK
jgi:hypothetical protein